MAQKRMFDKSIIENDYFMDLPLGAKALYFLLGMEADDEGFVSPKRVMKLYGGSDDDLKILIMKNFVIRFESGVVVITDRKENNRLDSRRIKETQYKLEKSLLKEDGNKYVLTYAKQMLSNGLESIEENSIEENKKPPKKPITETKPLQSINIILTDSEMERTRGLDILQEFVNYWGETNSRGKEKRQLQKTRDLNKRLTTRKKNKETNFGKKPQIDYEDINNFHNCWIKDITPAKEFFQKKYGFSKVGEHEKRVIEYNRVKSLYKQTDLYLKS